MSRAMYTSSRTRGTTADFYVKADGLSADYSLVVTRNADFDLENNNAIPQNVTGQAGVLGHISTLQEANADPDAAAANTIIDNLYPGVTFSNPLNAAAFTPSWQTSTRRPVRMSMAQPPMILPGSARGTMNSGNQASALLVGNGFMEMRPVRIPQ